MSFFLNYLCWFFYPITLLLVPEIRSSFLGTRPLYPTIYPAFGSLTKLPCSALPSSTMAQPGLHVIYDSASDDPTHAAELEYVL
jgi:hypothetical protein